MANSREYIVEAHIRERRLNIVLTNSNGELPSGVYINDPETNDTDERFARTLASEAAGHSPSLERTQRSIGRATFYFVLDRHQVSPSEGYSWRTEPSESTIEA